MIGRDRHDLAIRVLSQRVPHQRADEQRHVHHQRFHAYSTARGAGVGHSKDVQLRHRTRMSNSGTGRILYGAMAELRTVSEADALVRAHMPDFGTIEVPIAAAAGAVLREAVYAERDQPPFDRVTMDGIAISHAAWAAGSRSFRIQATQAAGQPALALDGPGACIEVMTGTALPAGADCVVPVEEITSADGSARIGDVARPVARQFVHARGSDYALGAELLARGTLVRGPEMAVLASAGQPTVRVARAPRVAVLAIGDELIDAGAPIADHQIRRSNDRAILAALRLHGIMEALGEHLPDDPAVLEDRIGVQLAAADVMILSGGVSMGRFDYVPRIMQALGVELVFHKVAQRPGKPMWFGTHASGKAVFALPGNPVSTLVCFTRYVLPAIAHAQGAPQAPAMRVALDSAVDFAPPLTWFLPVQIAQDAAGVARATPRPTNTSGDFAALAGTDGFVELPAEPKRFERGYLAPLYRW
jgi:molybdopterin molybdotransferase